MFWPKTLVIITKALQLKTFLNSPKAANLFALKKQLDFRATHFQKRPFSRLPLYKDLLWSRHCTDRDSHHCSAGMTPTLTWTHDFSKIVSSQKKASHWKVARLNHKHDGAICQTQRFESVKPTVAELRWHSGKTADICHSGRACVETNQAPESKLVKPSTDLYYCLYLEIEDSTIETYVWNHNSLIMRVIFKLCRSD